jgi:DNA-binding response OmpR family regulator
MNKLIAVIDDEPDILNLVSLHLKKGGFRTKEFLDVDSFYRFLKSEIPDLIILDLMLPDTDGYEVCKHLKKEDAFSGIPIIMLTARAEESERILGLELGADDYVTKPFSPRELVARVKVVLRRAQLGIPAPLEANMIQAGDLTIHPVEHTVYVGSRQVDLSPKEFELLRVLAYNAGRVVTTEYLLAQVWGAEYEGQPQVVYVHIRWLREKIEEDPNHPRRIITVRSVGYKLLGREA